MSYSDEIWGGLEPSIESLGESFAYVDVACWKPRMMFASGDDWLLRRYTATFPVSIGSTQSQHPIFVLETHVSYAHRVCPCTSRYRPRTLYIRAGCVLEQTGKVMARTSFVLESFAFNLPAGTRVLKKLIYWGRVPEECLKQNF